MDLLRAFANWHQRRRTIAELSALPDNLLADIGVERSRIPALVDSLLADAAERTGKPSAPAATGKKATGVKVALSGV